MQIELYSLINTALASSGAKVEFSRVDLYDDESVYINVLDNGTQYRPNGQTGIFERTQSLTVEVSVQLAQDYQQTLTNLLDYLVKLILGDSGLQSGLNEYFGLDITPTQLDMLGTVNRAMSSIDMTFKTAECIPVRCEGGEYDKIKLTLNSLVDVDKDMNPDNPLIEATYILNNPT